MHQQLKWMPAYNHGDSCLIKLLIKAIVSHAQAVCVSKQMRNIKEQALDQNCVL